ncbi:FecR domain-containing protein [Novosphingobium sp.]|uniref:FecR family protein n=1 Tax=Novosphingobium sp. TaxID=1874826 RepID=UPI00261F3B1B|nr:FecR domain-containing protein [Novosphingobium sp.]
MGARIHDLEQERIDLAAAEWFVQRADGDRAAGDDAFFAWLASDERHGLAYDQIAAAYEDLAQVPGLAERGAEVTAGRARSWERLRDWRLIGAMAAALLLAVMGLRIASAPPVASYVTAPGEIRTVVLADGSRLTLAPATAVAVQLLAGERRVLLGRGTAFFAVAHDRTRPFRVQAGPAGVTVLGTRFEVRKGSHETVVAVEQGRVEVADRAAIALGGGESVLGAGETGTVPNGSRYLAWEARHPAVRRLEGREVAAWRHGQLVYDDAPLASVLADIGRYYGPGVTGGETLPAGLRVTASFQVRDIPAFLAALPATLPVRVQGRPGQRYEVRSAPNG